VQAEKEIMDSFRDGDPVKAAQNWIELLNFVCVNCVVTPMFVEDDAEADPTRGIFWIGQMNFYDKQYIFQWAQGVDQSVQDFLQEQASALGTAPDGEGVRPTTEQLLSQGEPGNFLVVLPNRPRNLPVGPVHSGEDRRDDSGSGEQEQTTTHDPKTEVLAAADHGLSDETTRS